MFRRADIYVRRGSQSVRGGHDDIVKFMERAEEQGRRRASGQLKELTSELARLPKGSAPLLMAATPIGELHGTPQMLVDVAIHRRIGGAPRCSFGCWTGSIVNKSSGSCSSIPPWYTPRPSCLTAKP